MKPKNPPSSKSREHCFLITSFKTEYERICAQLSQMVEQHTGLRCERADWDPKPGRSLLGKVHELILGASVVIADVSELSPNVYYEYGYASAHDRLPILIARKGVKLPTDLVGKETLRYRDQPRTDTKFKKVFLECVDRQLRSPLPEQRRMLATPSPFPAYVIAAPRVPGTDSRHWWHPDEKHTFGDMLGITGILTAYGNLFGTRHLPELLHAKCVSRDILRRQANFFCIGSTKVNPATRHFLRVIHEGLSPRWTMPQLGPRPDTRVTFRHDSNKSLNTILKAPVEKASNGSTSDFGLIVRAPFPGDPRHSVLILAGRHSIGTHAACLTVTHQKLIASLEAQLAEAGVTLGNSSTPFWAVVRGTLLKTGKFSKRVEIIDAGGYQERDEN